MYGKAIRRCTVDDQATSSVSASISAYVAKPHAARKDTSTPAIRCGSLTPEGTSSRRSLCCSRSRRSNGCSPWKATNRRSFRCTRSGVQAIPSSCSSRAFSCGLPVTYPPMEPSARTTRWHGQSESWSWCRMVWPTQRLACRLPKAVARSPCVVIRPVAPAGADRRGAASDPGDSLIRRLDSRVDNLANALQDARPEQELQLTVLSRSVNPAAVACHATESAHPVTRSTCVVQWSAASAH